MPAVNPNPATATPPDTSAAVIIRFRFSVVFMVSFLWSCPPGQA
ncbi:hypothetical protein I551_7178 [Mycobacterium ulcerans str. Harvey]|uniref:Uncharacterized protein n=1 Tax=Mycobacterium ulcerans str. Harvey TaxID=1299332 RepID=A0ABP3A4Q5_MYCUL|nr:hypothetical protein I551_7178 [Mycobacterium ulcerans str. Harvey]